jgi:hypothetical protein
MDTSDVIVKNTLTGEVGAIRRRLFESPVFNPNGLLIEIEDTRSGCADCGIAPADCGDCEEAPVEDIQIEDAPIDEALTAEVEKASPPKPSNRKKSD